MAGILFTSGLLLVYTALVVPIQMLLWDYSNQCIMFPTLYIDMMVDSFFLVKFNSFKFVCLIVSYSDALLGVHLVVAERSLKSSFNFL
jgi:hypothetical protein